MLTFIKNSRAATRPYAKNLDMQHAFEHVRKVTEVAYIMAHGTGKNACDVGALMCHAMRSSDPKVHSAITQTAIRDGAKATGHTDYAAWRWCVIAKLCGRGILSHT